MFDKEQLLGMIDKALDSADSFDFDFYAETEQTVEDGWVVHKPTGRKTLSITIYNRQPKPPDSGE